MVESFRLVLSPLLIVSYVCGLRIVEFPAGHPRQFSLLYILLLWSIYFPLLICTVMPYMIYYTTLYYTCIWINVFIVLISIIDGVYYDKKFRNCLKRIAMVDNTLKQFGTTTNYQKLHTKTIYFVLGSFVITTLLTYGEALWLTHQFGYNAYIVIYIPSILNCSTQINLINDLIFTTILGYIGLKFDQINENIRKIVQHNEHEIRKAWENPVLHLCQYRLSKQIPSVKCMTWVIIHLHLELCKISREVNSMFGMQMTLKMGLYFGLLTIGFRELFNTIFVNNYVYKKIEFIVLNLFWIILYFVKLLLINYVCERVSVKANLTRNFINRISYITRDIEVRENVSFNIFQFLLQMTQSPLKFYGLRLFQFGNKFLHKFSTSIATVLVIIVQAHIKKYN